MSEQTPSDVDTREFWDAFAERHWEQSPLAYRGKPMARPIDPDKLFATIVRCCESELARPARFTRGTPLKRRLKKRVSQTFRLTPLPFGPEITLRFYVDRAPPRRPFARARYLAGHIARKDVLPRRSDGSFAGYHARIKRLLNPGWRRALGLPDRGYLLAVNFPELLDPELWAWEREFLRNLIARVGINNGGTYNAVFIGDYRRTPFGVHVDAESVFHIPVVGRKAMRAWPPEFVAAHPEIIRVTEYQAFVEDSTLLTAEPGRFIYWPSCDWHIAESAGDGLSVSVALSLIVAGRNPFIPRLGSAKPPPDRSPKTVPLDPGDLQGSVASVPGGLDLRMTQDSSPRIAWLKYATGLGFFNPPLPGPKRTLLPDDVFSGSPEWPVVYLEAGNELLVAANGHVFACPNQPGLKRVIAELNRPGRVTVQSLLEGMDGDAPDGLAFLSELASLTHRAEAASPD